MGRDLSGPVCEHGGRHPLPDMDGFAKTLEVYGITKDFPNRRVRFLDFLMWPFMVDAEILRYFQ